MPRDAPVKNAIFESVVVVVAGPLHEAADDAMVHNSDFFELDFGFGLTLEISQSTTHNLNFSQPWLQTLAVAGFRLVHCDC